MRASVEHLAQEWIFNLIIWLWHTVIASWVKKFPSYNKQKIGFLVFKIYKSSYFLPFGCYHMIQNMTQICWYNHYIVPVTWVSVQTEGQFVSWGNILGSSYSEMKWSKHSYITCIFFILKSCRSKPYLETTEDPIS